MATKKKTSPRDVRRADELLMTISHLLVEDENVGGSGAAGASVVLNLGESRSLFGYLYDAAGSAEPIVVEESDLLELATDLQEEMKAGGEPWKSVMIQIVGDDLRFTFDVDGDLWRLEGDNSGAMIEALRPEHMAPAKKKKAALAKKKAPAKAKAKPAAKKKPAPAKKKSRR